MESHGDPALAAKISELFPGRDHPVALATVSDGRVRTASRSVSLGADFELGSISKGITGLLYADAIARGEVTPDTTLGELLPLTGAPAADLTLSALSTHRSGLPRLPASMHPYRKTFAVWLRGINPYGETLDELIGQARQVKPGPPRPRYSNLGFELLGHAVARAAGMPYQELVRTRLTAPLGLDSVYVPASPGQLRPTAIRGTSKSGRPREPWTGEALGPAGGVRASITDAAALAAALLDGSAPGLAALDPVADFAGSAVRIGAAWITNDVEGRSITWHNGGTGGFRTWLGLDRAAATAAVILSATPASADKQGFRLLAEVTERSVHTTEP